MMNVSYNGDSLAFDDLQVETKRLQPLSRLIF